MSAVNPSASKRAPSMLQSGLLLALLAVAAKCMGLVREGLVAFHFGSSLDYNTFVIASRLPQLVLNMFLGGAVVGAFIPSFIKRQRARGEAEAWRYASSIGTLIMVASLALMGILMLAANPAVALMAPGLTAAQQLSAATTSRILALTLPVFTASTIAASLLNAHDRFRAPGGRQVSNNLAMILAITLLASAWGVRAMVFGFLAGSIVQLLIQLPQLRIVARGRFQRPNIQADDFREFSSVYLPIFATHLMLQGAPLLDARYGSLAGTAGVSSLAYAERFVDISRTIIGASLAVVIFPQLSRIASRKEDPGPLVGRGLGVVGLTVIPIVFALTSFGDAFIRVLYERGSFTPADTELVQSALIGLAPAALFYGMIYVLDRLFIAHGLVWQYAGLMGLGLLTNLGIKLNLLDSWGLTGVALGTTGGAAVTVGLALIYLRSRGYQALIRTTLLDLIATTGAFGLGFGAALGLAFYVNYTGPLSPFMGLAWSVVGAALGFAVLHAIKPPAYQLMLARLTRRK